MIGLYLVSARKPQFRTKSATRRHAFGEVSATESTAPAPLNGAWRQTRPHSRLQGTEGRSRLGAPSGAGETRRRWPWSGSAASSTSFGVTHATSHKQTDAVQVGGQYRQCNGVCKSIGAVGAHPVETAMLEVVDCRLDRRVLASCLGEYLRFLALALGHTLAVGPVSCLQLVAIVWVMGAQLDVSARDLALLAGFGVVHAAATVLLAEGVLRIRSRRGRLARRTGGAARAVVELADPLRDPAHADRRRQRYGLRATCRGDAPLPGRRARSRPPARSSVVLHAFSSSERAAAAERWLGARIGTERAWGELRG